MLQIYCNLQRMVAFLQMVGRKFSIPALLRQAKIEGALV